MCNNNFLGYFDIHQILSVLPNLALPSNSCPYDLQMNICFYFPWFCMKPVLLCIMIFAHIWVVLQTTLQCNFLVICLSLIYNISKDYNIWITFSTFMHKIKTLWYKMRPTVSSPLIECACVCSTNWSFTLLAMGELLDGTKTSGQCTAKFIFY